jgi:hypothetical protein
MKRVFSAVLGLMTALACLGVGVCADEPARNTDTARRDEVVKKIEQLGGVVHRVADNALEVDFHKSAVTDAGLSYVLSLENVVGLRLGETQITDAGLAYVAKIASLQRLHLEKTAISDAGVQRLAGLADLEYLNLFGTKVSDVGLERLGGLTKLKHLFVWQTKVTSAGISSLQKALPGIQIVPDPARDQQRAEAAWNVAKSALVHAENTLVVARAEAEKLAPSGAQFKKELDEAAKKSTEAKKRVDDATKTAEAANKRASELRTLADAADKRATTAPGEAGLKAQMDEKRFMAEGARQLASGFKKESDEAQKVFQAAQAATQAAQQRLAKVTNAKNAADEAGKHLEYYRTLEDDARTRLVGRAGTSGQADGWIKLFNGRDFTGWNTFLDPKSKVSPDTIWKVQDSMIFCEGSVNGYLITDKEYENYVLKVEWRWGDKVARSRNSGVFVHVTGPDQIWPMAVEAQLMADHAGDFWLVENFKLKIDPARRDPKVPRHYYRMKDHVEKKVGEWNQYEITCKGDSIKLVINGQLVNEGTGAENTKGKILLQSEGAEIYFRNVELNRLK